jgi:hypothetical protein
MFLRDRGTDDTARYSGRRRVADRLCDPRHDGRQHGAGIEDEPHVGLPARADDDRIDKDQITVEVERWLGRQRSKPANSLRRAARASADALAS